ncbi:DNA repair protein RecN [Jeongeupia chitinilytica]|uniref:DNA repair protein RecN n=1 Tax=Jeongeupia chitinilytica TaxID=1041641 RepID=A0ABQ3H057_9NEIS|nr:DNA repair protein RecN [Jeongeupia chitinilytica]GHD60904.1 DNA repair protein RecN [Jeongeupia chitinilytica]
MLLSLRLKNFVIVDELALDFAAGLTVLTGETGAGKSIVLDALGLLLGDRAESGIIRHGCERAELAAEFELGDVPAASAWLVESDLVDADPARLVLRRTIDIHGKNRAFINGSPATLAQIKAVGELLVDIHGQHAHQRLLRAEVQRQVLDAYAGAEALAVELADAWRGWRRLADELDAAHRNAATFEAERERLQWQIDEVAALSLGDDEWAALQSEHKRLHHAASLIDGVQAALLALADGDENCQGWLGGAQHRVDELAGYDDGLTEARELLASTDAQLTEAVNTLRRYADGLELDPQRLSDVESRMDAIWRTARKYRCEPEQLAGLLAEWQDRLDTLGGRDGLARLEADVARAEKSAHALAAKLSARRKGAAPKLAEAVTREMRPLALADSRFEIALTPLDKLTAHGAESIEFLVGHGGAPARAMAKIVSGGELSRISLALQVIAATQGGISTFVFDEVDVGIGGRVAEIVGRLLADLGANRQVLCITHLPQVAACGHQHLQVSKASTPAGIVSAVRPLSSDERIEEIARMLGGVEITETTRRHAAELLGLVQSA